MTWAKVHLRDHTEKQVQLVGFGAFPFGGEGRSKVQTPKLRWIPNIDGLERVTRFIFWHLFYLDLSGRYYFLNTLLL